MSYSDQGKNGSIDQKEKDLNQKMNDFFRRYEVKVESDMRRRAIMPPPPTFFVDSADASVSCANHEIKHEKLYTISIPESRLRALVQMEERVSRYVEQPGGINLLSDLLDKEREESFYREQNEAIKTAYEQYSMLLHLAGYQRRF